MPAGEMLIADVMGVLSDKPVTVRTILTMIGGSGVTPRAVRYALTHLIETGKARKASDHGFYCAMNVMARVGVHSSKACG